MFDLKKITKHAYRWLICLPLISFLACTESITIDPPEGRMRPVVEGSFTNELKRHEVILSYSSELYSHEKKMISNADVFVISGNDTVWYYEQPDRPGHYLTDSIAGKKQRKYRLKVYIGENELYNRPISMYADSKIPNNITQIDSLRLLPLRNKDGIPFVNDSAAVCVCPYFQALADSNIVFNVELYLNGKRFRNRPSKLFDLFPMQGYAGYYFNGPEMLQNNIEIPVGIMNKSYLHEGDVVKLKLISITKDYLYFLVSQKLAVGVNPIMGAYSMNLTNIFSDCNAIGWFSTTSSVEAECVYHEW